MKKFLSLFLTVALLLCCIPVASVAAEEKKVTLNVYNWGEYIDPEVNALFEEEYPHIKVNYLNFTDNESMYTQVAAGASPYDIIIPSDYMIGKLINEDLLLPLDFENIPNFKHINPSLKNLSYDPENRFSVPYTWGTVGIFYNEKYVHEDEEYLRELGWDLLWDEKYSGHILMFDNPRDAFGIALNKCGYSMNTQNEQEWEEAYQALVEQKPLLHQYVMDQVFDKMINEEAWIAPYYSGDGIMMMAPEEEGGNPSIKYFVPNSGTNKFVDAMCIPKCAQNKKEAELYINFMCRTDIALRNAEYIGYSTPHLEAQAQLDPEIGGDTNFYPTEEMLSRTEVFETLPSETSKKMDELWMKLKLANPLWGICTAVVGVIAVVCLIWYVITMARKPKKKR